MLVKAGLGMNELGILPAELKVNYSVYSKRTFFRLSELCGIFPLVCRRQK